MSSDRKPDRKKKTLKEKLTLLELLELTTIQSQTRFQFQRLRLIYKHNCGDIYQGKTKCQCKVGLESA